MYRLEINVRNMIGCRTIAVKTGSEATDQVISDLGISDFGILVENRQKVSAGIHTLRDAESVVFRTKHRGKVESIVVTKIMMGKYNDK